MRLEISALLVFLSLDAAAADLPTPPIENCAPVPNLIDPSAPEFPELPVDARGFQGGRVVLELEIDENGHVRNPVVLESDIEERHVKRFKEAALRTARSWQFEPPSKLCRARIPITYKMSE